MGLFDDPSSLPDWFTNGEFTGHVCSDGCTCRGCRPTSKDELPFNVIDNSREDLRRLPDILRSHTIIYPPNGNGCAHCDLTGWELLVMPCEPPDNWWSQFGSARQ